MDELDRIILNGAEELEIVFWNKLIRDCYDFPDIEESDDAKVLILELAITKIISKYLLMFKRQFRATRLEDLITELREIELERRDM